MATIGDVNVLYNYVDLSQALFESSEEFWSEFYRRYQEIGKAICTEQNLEFGAVNDLPPEDTVLGEQSHELFRELQEWINTKSPIPTEVI